MKTYSILVFLLTFIFSINIYSQTESKKIDSLKNTIQQKTDTAKARVYMQLIDFYFENQKDSAEVYILKTLEISESIEVLKETYIHALLKYAQLFLVKGDYLKSQQFYEKAWKIMKKEYNYFLYNKYYGDYGVLNFYQGDFKSAKDNFAKALALAEKEKNEIDQLRYLNNKALAMSYLGEANTSLDVHQKAIVLAQKLNDSTSLGKSFNNIGLIYEDMKEYQKALEFYHQALEIKKNGKSKIDIANSLYNIASMYKEIGKKSKDTLLYHKAEDYYEKALKIGKKINYGKIILFTKTGMAQLATARSQPQKAIEIYKIVVNEAKKANDNQTLRVTYLNLGVNYQLINNTKEAERYLLLAKPLIEESKNPADLAKLNKNLSLLYEQKRDYKKAFSYLLAQKKLEENLTENSLQEKITNFEVKYNTEKKEKEIIAQKQQLLEQELTIRNRELYAILISAILIILGIVFFAVYKRNQFKRDQLKKEIDLKDALATITTQNRLQEQRLRISRDLHDNIGSQLTFIISSIDNLKYISKNSNEKLKEKLTEISAFTGNTIHQLRNTIWAMNKNEISIADLHARILSFVEKAKTAIENINFTITNKVDKEISLNSLKGMNIFRAIQEAINNALKYAEAKNISIVLTEDKQNLYISIKDDGKGFDLNTVDLGNGLSNIEKRMSEIDGKVTITSKPEIGTEIKLTIKSLNAI